MSPLFGNRKAKRVRKRSAIARSTERSGSSPNAGARSKGASRKEASRKGLARLIPPPPGSARNATSENGSAETPKTRSYSAQDILVENSSTTSQEPASNGHGDHNADADPGGGDAEGRSTERFKGLRYKKDGRIGRKDEEDNREPERIFDAEGTLWSKIIFWMVTVLAVLGALFLSFVLLRAAIALWPGGEDSQGSATAVTEAASTGEERAAASLATGFSESYLTMNADEDTSSIEERLAPFVANTELAALIAQSSDGESEREVLSASAYRVQQVSDGRYAVFVDALTSSGSSTEGESSDGTDDEGPAVQRQAMKVYVGGSDGRYAVVAPPTAITPPSAGDDVDGALGAGDSYELTDDALEDHLRGYFSASYGTSDAQGSVEEFFAGGAEMPAAPAEDYTYLDLEGATLYEVAPEEVGEGYTEAYQVEAYVSVREESTGAVSNQTHLLQVAKQEGGEWTITGSIGG